jgi:hypothetical protein
MMYPYLRTFMTVATQMVARFNGSTAYDKKQCFREYNDRRGEKGI